MFQSVVKHSIWVYCIVSILLFSCFATPFQNSLTDPTDQKLNEVKSAIVSTQSEINQFNKKRKALENKLKKDDLAISSVTQRINKNKSTQSNIKKELTLLLNNKNELIKDKKKQEQVLSKQLRASYSSGNNDYLTLLLNQKEPANVQRTLTYYKYINDARVKEIKSFQSTIKQLINIEDTHRNKVEKLSNVMERLAQNKAVLEKNKKNRSATIASLNKQQLSKKQQLNELLSQETSLTNALQNLLPKVSPQKPLNGLAKVKRKLSWPIAGKIKHRFGTQKSGYIKWKGILKQAPLGTQVNAVYDGTILFSDWLKGYGLVTIIDHGQGYMSLYGHNQTLLKKVGDYVEKGEAISLVGKSGGQLDTGLYFEIRHAGKAVNPKIWCR